MRRRRLLSAAAGLGATGLAGCSGLIQTRPFPRAPPVPENRPDAVYYPSHIEGMQMLGMTAAGDYKFGLMYSYPHRFWNVNGREVSKTPIDGDDSLHLMATVWEPETGVVLPETGLSVNIKQDGEFVSQEVIYPMLSQPMGFHYGANFALPGEGTYTAELSVGAMPTRRTGAFRDRFTEPVSASVEFEFSHSKMNEISWETLDEKAGTEGSVDAMQMGMMPSSLAPAPGDLPGSVVGETSAGDARFVLTVLDSPPAGVDGSGQYLALSARTPYNRMILPAMGAEATLTRDGDVVAEGPLTRTLDPDLNYHYGLAVDAVESGDVLSVSVPTPPQVARHEGYETAFLELEPFEFTV
jgi:hypothetical protein